MATKDYLDSYLRQMKYWTQLGDAEIAHSEADQVLIATLRVLASSVDEQEALVINQIIEAWQVIEKWYA